MHHDELPKEQRLSKVGQPQIGPECLSFSPQPAQFFNFSKNWKRHGRLAVAPFFAGPGTEFYMARTMR